MFISFYVNILLYCYKDLIDLKVIRNSCYFLAQVRAPRGRLVTVAIALPGVLLPNRKRSALAHSWSRGLRKYAFPPTDTVQDQGG